MAENMPFRDIKAVNFPGYNYLAIVWMFPHEVHTSPRFYTEHTYLHGIFPLHS
jgi:hypothetical protein